MCSTKKIFKLLKYNSPGILSAGIWSAIAKTALQESEMGNANMVIGVALGLLASGCLIGNYLFCRSERYPSISVQEAEKSALDDSSFPFMYPRTNSGVVLDISPGVGGYLAFNSN